MIFVRISVANKVLSLSLSLSLSLVKSSRVHGRKPGTKCGGRPVQVVWGIEVPQWGPPVVGLEDEVPQKLNQFWISICIILTEF